jgi:hypothetical protein
MRLDEKDFPRISKEHAQRIWACCVGAWEDTLRIMEGYGLIKGHHADNEIAARAIEVIEQWSSGKIGNKTASIRIDELLSGRKLTDGEKAEKVIGIIEEWKKGRVSSEWGIIMIDRLLKGIDDGYKGR